MPYLILAGFKTKYCVSYSLFRICEYIEKSRLLLLKQMWDDDWIPFPAAVGAGEAQNWLSFDKEYTVVQKSVALRAVYRKSEGKIFQDKIQALRHITHCQRCDLYQTEITITI